MSQTCTYRCRYCRAPMHVSTAVIEEYPFCAGCLHERVARARLGIDPLDGPRLECGLPVLRIGALRPRTGEETER